MWVHLNTYKLLIMLKLKRKKSNYTHLIAFGEIKKQTIAKIFEVYFIDLLENP
jgi:hypothetical protein